MAERFVEQATAQLAPVYDQQVQTLQSQVPAIQQLYQSLMQGLEAQGKTQTQGILESSASRGLTRSSIPVDLQTTLAQTLMGEKSKLGAQQAQDIAGINMKVGDLGIQRAQAIQGLADTLYNRDMKEREFQMQQQAAERDFQMKQAAAAAASRGGGGSGGIDIPIKKNAQGGWDVGGGYDLAGYARATGKDLITLLSQGDAKDKQAANWYLEKIRKYGNKNADIYFQELMRDRPTAFYRGG